MAAMKALIEIHLTKTPQHPFKVDMDAERVLCNLFTIEAVNEEQAAERAFVITNAPEEVLSDEYLALSKEYFSGLARPSNATAKPRPISVGDMVVVKMGEKTTELVCASSGWVKFEVKA